MTDKPDVAALAMTHLLSWLPEGYTHCKYGPREWCESYLNNARDVIEAQASELTRLAARAKNEREKGFGEGRSECLAAKAEIARLTDLAQQRKWQLEECESDLAKAEDEIARLNASLTVTAQEYAFLKDAYDELKLDTEKAEAEIARLRAVAQEDLEREAHDRLGEFFLKPDTGEAP